MKWLRRRRPAVPDPVRQNIQSVTAIERDLARQRTILDKVSERIARFVGSFAFLFAHLVLFATWILLNHPGPSGSSTLDPFPYPFLSFLLAAEVVLLTTFVLVNQNRQTRQAEHWEHVSLQISLLAEQEATKTLRMLQKISERLGLSDIANDPELAHLLQATHLPGLAQELQTMREPGAR